LGHPVKSFKLQSPQIRYSTVPVLRFIQHALCNYITKKKRKADVKRRLTRYRKDSLSCRTVYAPLCWCNH